MSDNSDDDEQPGKFKNNVRVVVRIRPLIQGESVMNRRVITEKGKYEPLIEQSVKEDKLGIV